jgi:hypothetical protein
MLAQNVAADVFSSFEVSIANDVFYASNDLVGEPCDLVRSAVESRKLFVAILRTRDDAKNCGTS